MRPNRIVPSLIAALIVLLFAGTLWFLWAKSRPKPVVVETEKPAVADVVRKTVAAGTLQPRKEIEIKPKVSGILRQLFVEPGKQVKAGDLIAEIQIIPDVVNLNEAELRLRAARLNEETAKRELDRVTALGSKGAAALGELDQLRSQHRLAQEELRGAEMRVRLVREGAVSRNKAASTRVESTVAGTVLALPVREGSSVINANSFNPGTTVAIVADMTDMIFKGRIDEAEVGRLREGMPVEIVVGALEELKFSGTLEHISPRSLVSSSQTQQQQGGTTEFEVEAAFRPPQGVLVRAGYSANANIVLDRRDKVLTISESLLSFEADRRFVEVLVDPATHKYERREVKLGLSDGLRVEVLGGVKPSDVMRKPVAAGGPGRT